MYARLSAVPEPLTVLGTVVALGVGTALRRRPAAIP
ncbi:MAG: PEP-CTERM sorting domain-containing protein [Prochlorothrix sp.]|nr:PEP-CTERM sorting domain-containing protein [Prochlorothrix sp.]